jgi:hypothetical protein
VNGPDVFGVVGELHPPHCGVIEVGGVDGFHLRTRRQARLRRW